jgi:site-specific recombinase XerD
VACVRKGLNLQTIADLMGHRSISTTSHYLRTLGDDTVFLHEEAAKVSHAPK